MIGKSSLLSTFVNASFELYITLYVVKISEQESILLIFLGATKLTFRLKLITRLLIGHQNIIQNAGDAFLIEFQDIFMS